LNGYGGYGAMQIEYSKFYSEPSVVISDNIMRKTWGPGIILFGYDKGAYLTKGILISHNQFLECGYSHSIADTGGISVQGLKGVTIEKNTADKCYNAFVFVVKGGAGTVIKYNTIKNTQPHRIFIMGRAKNPVGSGYAISNLAGSKLVISSNTFSNNKYGNFYRCSGT
jgi:hypothetical protein